MVASAFISGRNPNLIREKMRIGRVLDPGPRHKACDHQIIKREREGQKPDNIPGARRGRVIAVSTLKGFAPRSEAASSKVSPSPVRRD